MTRKKSLYIFSTHIHCRPNYTVHVNNKITLFPPVFSTCGSLNLQLWNLRIRRVDCIQFRKVIQPLSIVENSRGAEVSQTWVQIMAVAVELGPQFPGY